MKRKNTKFILNTKPTIIMKPGEYSQITKAVILLSQLAIGIIICLKIWDII